MVYRFFEVYDDFCIWFIIYNLKLHRITNGSTRIARRNAYLIKGAEERGQALHLTCVAQNRGINLFDLTDLTVSFSVRIQPANATCALKCSAP